MRWLFARKGNVESGMIQSSDQSDQFYDMKFSCILIDSEIFGKFRNWNRFYTSRKILYCMKLNDIRWYFSWQKQHSFRVVLFHSMSVLALPQSGCFRFWSRYFQLCLTLILKEQICLLNYRNLSIVHVTISNQCPF